MRKTWFAELSIVKNVVPTKHVKPSKNDILASSFITCPPGYDSYVMLGESNDPQATYHLIQMAFTTDLSHLIKYNDELYRNLLARAGQHGVESSRSGGLQGLCSSNKLMRKHLHNPGSFPHHANGILIIIVN
eukprot:679456-Ditylum_brightwellii.AAC.1